MLFKIWENMEQVRHSLLSRLLFISKTTAQKMEVSIKDIFGKSLMENIFCAVDLAGIIMWALWYGINSQKAK